jgi:hypothetical protein
MKGEVDKDIEILKKNQTEILEMKSPKSKIKNSIESLSSRLYDYQGLNLMAHMSLS